MLMIALVVVTVLALGTMFALIARRPRTAPPPARPRRRRQAEVDLGDVDWSWPS